MSEQVDYYGEFKNFQNPEERSEFVELARNFQGADVEEREDKNTVHIYVSSGWRGGGLSCEEVVEEHFRDWLDEHEEVKGFFNATYLKHAPTERVMSRGDV